MRRTVKLGPAGRFVPDCFDRMCEYGPLYFSEGGIELGEHNMRKTRKLKDIILI